jgi:hypothetical protein
MRRAGAERSFRPSLAHSSDCRAQNWAHPSGGCVTSEVRTIIKTVLDFKLKTLAVALATVMENPDVTSARHTWH